ncbi:hypothetical protein DER44DRAFT_820270 [Fusarium oxysporum]|nr:hypothetical protein DER44DRAFT_820270 [Fusarium oxysporum]
MTDTLAINDFQRRLASPFQVQRNRPPLQVIYQCPGDDVDVDIIAVHGLGANVDWSWTWKSEADPGRLVKWLEDPDMLPAVVPRSRIVLYNYDSRWHVDAPKTRLQLCGEDLARSTHNFRRGTVGRPIVFIGHSLGGNVIQHGLLYANSDNDFKDVANCTVGVVLLGSPLRGTKLQFLPRLLTAMMQPAGSHDGIIKELAYDDPGLRDKLQDFCRMLNTLSIQTSCFFELYKSDYGQRRFVPGVIKGMVYLVP